MNSNETHSIQDLFKRSPISISELGRRSKVSEVTAAKIRDGKRARIHSVNRLLATFSELYGITLTVDNVTGLNILQGRYGEREQKTQGTKEDHAA
jgi:transcriptional regulator with XRE-family HTH domain